MANRQSTTPDTDDDEGGGFGLASLKSILHAIWLKRWFILIVWILISLPTGIFFSLVDLPQSYRVSTVLRFPAVIGAQTSVMRDVAITENESIINIFKSFQVLERTIQALGLQLRVENQNLFPKYMFRSMSFTESAPPGVYKITHTGGKVVVTLKPQRGGDDLVVFAGKLPPNGRMDGGGLILDWLPLGLEAMRREPIELSLTEMTPLVEKLRKSIRINSMGSNLEVGLEDRDPFLVAKILNTLVDEFLKVYYGTTEVQEVGVLVQMEKDVELAKKRLEESQNEVAAYYREHPELTQTNDAGPSDNLAMLGTQTEWMRVGEQLERLQKTYAAKPADMESDQAFFWMSDLLGLMVEAGDAKASILRGTLGELRAKSQKAQAEYGPGHPKLKEIEAEKAGFASQLDDVYKPLRSSLQNKVDALKAKLSQVAVRQAGPSVKAQLELQRLTEVNRNNQDIYNRLQESYNRAKLVTGSEFFKVTIVDPARPATYKPPTHGGRLAVAGVAVCALFFFLVAAFGVYQFLFRKIWTKEDIRALLGISPLGTVPEGNVILPKDNEEANEATKRRMAIEPLLLFYGSSHSLAELESYRLIREEAEGLFKGKDKSGKLCLMITSTQPGEGKTLISSNIALTFARKGKRTLLVDADFRLGRIAKAFQSDPSTGLDEMLSQTDLTEPEFLEAASLCFVPSMQKDLILVPRKVSNPNAGELVSSDRFKAFLKLAKEQFDVVIVDTPPVGITPEPLGLLDEVDGVVFVCRSGMVSASAAKASVELMSSRKVKIAAVLNGLEFTPFEDNHYRKYAYYYSAGHGDKPGNGKAAAPPKKKPG